MNKIASLYLILFVLLASVTLDFSNEVRNSRDLNNSNRSLSQEKTNLEKLPGAGAYTSYDLQQSKDNPPRIIFRGVVTLL